MPNQQANVNTTLLLERETGVVEVEVEIQPQLDGHLVMVRNGVVLSGIEQPIEPLEIVQAIQLKAWARRNLTVFAECRTSPTEDSV